MEQQLPSTTDELTIEAKKIISYIYPSLINDDGAISDVSFTIYKCSETFDPEKKIKFNSYLYRACRNNLLKYARQKHKYQERYKSIDNCNNISYDEVYIDEILETLNEVEKYVVINKVIFDNSFVDIAKDLEQSVMEIYRIYNRSMKRLRTQ